MSNNDIQHELDILRQQEREQQAHLTHLTYNDAPKRMAENCNNCGDNDPWYPRCEKHEPI